MSSISSSSEAFCPFCQVPFELIKLLGKNMHLEVCFRSQKPKEECPKGVRCRSEMICHYKKFSHTELAQKRANAKQLSSAQVLLLSSGSEDDDGDAFRLNKTSSLASKLPSNESLNKSLHEGSADKSRPSNQETDLLATDQRVDNDKSLNRNNLSTAGSITRITTPTKACRKKQCTNKSISAKKLMLDCSSASYQNIVKIKEEPVDLNESSFYSSMLTSTQNIKQETDPFPSFSASPIASKSPHRSRKRPSQEESSPSKSLRLSSEDTVADSTLNQTTCQDKSSFSQLNFKGSDSLKKNMKNGNIATFFGITVPKKSPKKPIVEKPTAASVKLPWKSKTSFKSCPFYKKVEGTKIAVDAFNYGKVAGINYYFLSHFHYDHYIGLTSKWSDKIYCSEVTGNLVKMRWKSLAHLVVSLPLDETVKVDDFEVTLLEANHCPGAAVLVFKLVNGKYVLHTGDFRADEKMTSELVSRGFYFSLLYLDTTYLNPQYAFPPQAEVVNFATAKVLECLDLCPDTLVISGTYTIGKEKIFVNIADKLGCKICVDKQKYKTMCCYNDERLKAMLTLDQNETNLRVVQMKQLSWPSLKQIFSKNSHKYSKLLAIKPTGWTYDKCASNDLNKLNISFDKSIILMELPYSEHSSFSELQNFVHALKPSKIVPTVNVGNPSHRSMMNSYLNSWKQ